jgi:hypothetical protein
MLVDVHGQRRHRAVEDQPPVPVPARVDLEPDPLSSSHE